MKRAPIAGVVAVLFVLCAGAAAQNNAVPFVNQTLSPVSIAPGSKSFTLTVNGTGFAPTAVVNWNGSTRITEVISSSQLKATINSSDVATAQTAWITVTNPAPGGGISNVVFFPVRTESSFMGMAISQPFAGATAIAVGDFNNDGKLDVAWAASGSINISLGNGDGTFQPAIVNSAPPTANYLFTGDFNGDGNLDLALGNDQGVTVFLNNGEGTLTESFNSDQFFGGNNGIAVADFNQDGKLDIYIAGWDAGYDYFTILTGNGNGTFNTGGSGGYVTGSPQGFGGFGLLSGVPAIGDFNGDGYLDLAIGGYQNTDEGEIEIFLGGPNGSFSQSTTLTGVYAENLFTADVNGDGKLDLITDSGCVLLGNGDGTFQSCNGLPISGEIDGVGDFTGARKADIADASETGYDPVAAINLGAGNGTFPNSFEFSGPANGIASGGIGDFINDGELDVVTSDGYLMIQTTVDLTPIALSFGNQNDGTTSAPQTATLTNVGSASLSVEKVGITGTGAKDFSQTNNCGASLAAGASCTISVTFTPISGATFTATLSVGYKGTASPETVALSGIGVAPPTATLKPASLTFATQLVGTSSAAQTATLSDTSQQILNISSVSVSGPFSQTNDCFSGILPESSCQIQVVFTPTAAGTASGTLTVVDNAVSSPQQITLKGIGTVMTLSPVSVNFGDENVGSTSSAAPVSLTNIGASAVKIDSISITGADPKDFAESNNCGGNLAANASCTILVRFKPTATGARSASLTVTDSGGGSPQSVALSGTGT
jgi:hypothetical protein